MSLAPITSHIKKNYLPTHVNLPPSIGLPAWSMVMLEQVRTIDKCRLGDYVTSIEYDLMDYIDDALGISLGLGEPEKPDEMILCLCPTCLSQFINSPFHKVRRANPFSRIKSDCTYCQVRKGYDYHIQRIEKKKPLGRRRSSFADMCWVSGCLSVSGRIRRL